jgi:hypothetical protein
LSKIQFWNISTSRVEEILSYIVWWDLMMSLWPKQLSKHQIQVLL